MPTPSKGPRLASTPAHERLMLANLASALFEHGSITTTEHKARRLRPYAERLITKAKRGDLHARRQALAIVREKQVVHKLFEEANEKFGHSAGGYTRVVKLGRRAGDAAPMALIELVAIESGGKKKTKKKAAKRGAAKTKAAAAKKTAAQAKDEKKPPEKKEAKTEAKKKTAAKLKTSKTKSTAREKSEAKPKTAATTKSTAEKKETASEDKPKRTSKTKVEKDEKKS